jgi:hypothetical protein
MRTIPILAILAVAPTLGGCVADGWYVVRGRVTAEASGSTLPVSGATVVARDGPTGRRQQPTTTEADGTYTVKYWFGGMWLIIPPGPGDPYLEFTAPGFEPKFVQLRDASLGATSCGPKAAPWCFVLDVVLRPENASPVSSPANG